MRTCQFNLSRLINTSEFREEQSFATLLSAKEVKAGGVSLMTRSYVWTQTERGTLLDHRNAEFSLGFQSLSNNVLASSNLTTGNFKF